MKKDAGLKILENEITELGDTLMLMESLIKTIDIITDDKINFEKQDMKNLTVILRKMTETINKQYLSVKSLFRLQKN